LSHCAIVARELGLPTIVNARGVMAAVAAADDGVDVTVDAAAGTITIPRSRQVSP
jgi:phosphohistidine swiveling domain-containing protein